MRTFIALFAFTISSAASWAGAGTPSLEEQLRKEYAGTEQLLRYFNAENNLKFDAKGNPVGKETPAPWTLTAPVAITKVELKEGKLRMHGPRQLLVFDNTKELTKRIRTDERFSIEVETVSGPEQEKQLREALARVFIGKNEPLPPLLPDYWRDYIARMDGRHTETEACAGWKLPKAGTPVQPASVTEGMKIHGAPIIYPRIARQYQVQGMVEMQAVIDKDGNIGGMCLIRAAGAGLDDMLADAVRQWKYRPYMVNGQPVEVETIIRTSFHHD
jgi:TonB family protein